MQALPALGGRAVVKVFESFGWEVARQRGSHIILVKDNHNATLSVPDHKEVAKGTLRSLIRAAGLTVEELRAPAHDGHDSGAMADSVPAARRTPLRNDGGQFLARPRNAVRHGGMVSAMRPE